MTTIILTPSYVWQSFEIFLPVWTNWHFPRYQISTLVLSVLIKCPINIRHFHFLRSPRSHSRRYQCSSWCFFTWSPTLIPIVLIISQCFCTPTSHLLLQLSTNVSWRQKQLINSRSTHNVVLNITLIFACYNWIGKREFEISHQIHKEYTGVRFHIYGVKIKFLNPSACCIMHPSHTVYLHILTIWLTYFRLPVRKSNTRLWSVSTIIDSNVIFVRPTSTLAAI